MAKYSQRKPTKYTEYLKECPYDREGSIQEHPSLSHHQQEVVQLQGPAGVIPEGPHLHHAHHCGHTGHTINCQLRENSHLKQDMGL